MAGTTRKRKHRIRLYRTIDSIYRSLDKQKSILPGRRSVFHIMQKIKKNKQKYICPTEMPILETATTKDCEIETFLRPSVAAYRQCDVRTKTQHSGFWRHLPSQGGWLYSLESPETMHILCPGLKETTTIITGTGVLYLSANCMGRTGSTTLTGIRTYDNKNQFFYTPPNQFKHKVLNTRSKQHAQRNKGIRSTI